MITPENWCIADSTPLLTLLDARMAEPSFYPAGGVGWELRRIFCVFCGKL